MLRTWKHWLGGEFPEELAELFTDLEHGLFSASEGAVQCLRLFADPSNGASGDTGLFKEIQ